MFFRRTERPADPGASDRLLDAARADASRTPDAEPLARLLSAAAAPARPGELAGEEDALAAFRAARAAGPAAGTVPSPRRRRFTAGAMAWGAGIAVTATAGAAFAAVTLERADDPAPRPAPPPRRRRPRARIGTDRPETPVAVPPGPRPTPPPPRPRAHPPPAAPPATRRDRPSSTPDNCTDSAVRTWPRSRRSGRRPWTPPRSRAWWPRRAAGSRSKASAGNCCPRWRRRSRRTSRRRRGRARPRLPPRPTDAPRGRSRPLILPARRDGSGPPFPLHVPAGRAEFVC